MVIHFAASYLSQPSGQPAPFQPVIALLIERRNQTGQSEKVCNRRDAAGLSYLCRRGYLTPVRFADEHYSPVLEAFASRSIVPATPPQSSCANAGRHVTFFIRDVAGRVVMNEMDAFADAEFLCAPRGLRGEERAHIDTDTGNGVIPSPVQSISPEPLPRSRMRVPASCVTRGPASRTSLV